MSPETQPASTQSDDGLVEIPACDNSAVAFCCEAWFQAHDEALADGESEVVSRVAGHEAYREAMPPLNGTSNIRNYIACVAHGMAINAILPELGARLLYAAQVANGARKIISPGKKRLPKHSSPGVNESRKSNRQLQIVSSQQVPNQATDGI